VSARVEATGLRFRYPEGGFALDLPHLAIEPGETVACIGPSGCGKTTLLRLLTGQLVPDAGAVALADRPLSGLSEEARRARRLREVGLVFQDFALLDYLSARENLLLPYRLSPALRLDEAARARADQLARATGLADLLGRKPAHLSQGEQQRVALCRALVTEPGLVIADEPTGNLDPETAAAAVDLLFEQVRARGTTLLVVTHDHGLLPRFDRVLDLAEGAA
jgi:putative ABC transport system ATP-binding protein